MMRRIGKGRNEKHEQTQGTDKYKKGLNRYTDIERNGLNVGKKSWKWK